MKIFRTGGSLGGETGGVETSAREGVTAEPRTCHQKLSMSIDASGDKRKHQIKPDFLTPCGSSAQWVVFVIGLPQSSERPCLMIARAVDWLETGKASTGLTCITG